MKIGTNTVDKHRSDVLNRLMNLNLWKTVKMPKNLRKHQKVIEYEP